jgi:Na+-driven multidrug efflux pump/anti-sigma regulatory factor (Ser/Thr protein kinase)
MERKIKKMSGAKLTQKVMFKLLPVQILLVVVGVVNGIISSLFAGNYVGVNAMEAVGLYGPVTQLMIALNIMLVSGSVILCGEYMGRHDHGMVQKIFALDITLSGLLALIITLVHIIFGVAGSGMNVVSDPEVNLMLCRYVIGQAVGIFPLILGNQLSAFLSLDNKGSRTMTASLIYIAVNFILNYLLVAVMQLGVFGLAVAPAIGMWTYFLIQLPPFLKKDADMRFTLKKIDWHEAAQIAKIGVPGAANTAYYAIRGIIVNSLVLTYVGGVGISAFTAANAILSFFWAVPGGMLAVSRMMISVSVGEEDRKTLTDTMRVALYRFMPLCFIMAFVIMLLAEPFTMLYFRDPADPVYHMTVLGFRILPVCMPLSIICTHFSCYWQASDRPVPVHILAVLDGVVGVVTFTTLLIGRMGITALYLANVLNGLIAPVVVMIYATIHKKRFSIKLEDIMVIPDEFGVPDEDRLEITMEDMEGVTGVSESLQGFCMERGIDRRRAFLASLCLEEMAGNVVKHGFSADGKKHSVHLCVACKKETLILSIKDDCIPFNLKQRQQMMDPEDMSKNIGIRIVSNLASDIQSQNTLGLNVLTIRLDDEAGA